MDDALTLERDGFREHRGGIDRVDEVDRAIECALWGAHAYDFGHQLHQTAFAAIWIAPKSGVILQGMGAGNGVVGQPAACNSTPSSRIPASLARSQRNNAASALS